MGHRAGGPGFRWADPEGDWNRCLDDQVGEDDQFVGYKSLAIQLRNRFQKEIGISTNRVGLPPFEEMERLVLEDLFRPNSPLMHPVLLEQLRLVLKLSEEYGKDLEPFPDPQQPVQGPEPESVSAPDEN